MDTKAFGAIAALTTLAGGALANPILIADSVDDFGGVQGENGWSYGWYSQDDVSTGAPVGVNTSAFNQFTSFNSGTGWWSTDPFSAASTPGQGSSPGTYAVITAELMHAHAPSPLANLSAENLWVSRRWTSNTSGVVTLSGSIAHDDYGGGFMAGNGTEAHILVDGVAVFSYDVQFQDFVGTEYLFDVAVGQGTTIEMLLGAKGDPSFDATRFDMQISVVPAPGAVALIGLGGVLTGVRRRR